jgi:DnaJ-class molecular chaperone
VQTATLILLALPISGVYLISCRVWPFTSCRKCDGAGRFRSPNGRAWRYCRRCNGNGSRLRTGRRVMNYLAGIRSGDR